MRALFLLLLLTSSSCISANLMAVSKDQIGDQFTGFEGCYLLYNMKTNKFDIEFNPQLCKERESPCSTFKVPLSLMAFDAKVLKDENTLFRWDGKKRSREVLNKDHTAASWMKDSVLWYSQRVTPKLGMKKMKKYLREFDYGNEDLSGGLQTSWLASNDVKDSLKISPVEQIEFMKKWWKKTLPVSQHAYDMTNKITLLELSPHGYMWNGKTGSGFLGKNNERQIGWFIGHIQKGDDEYLSVVMIKQKEGTDFKGPAGLKAKDITQKLLISAGLW